MKFLSYLNDHKEERLAIVVLDRHYDLHEHVPALPATMADFLMGEEHSMDLARQFDRQIRDGKSFKALAPETMTILAAVPHPTSCRDAYAFRQHVAAARRNRGVDMVAEYDQFPIFYFTNHHSIIGPGELRVEKDHLERLDFELEAAIVIGKRGKNIPSSKADSYIAGYTIMNDFSARKLQMEEMLLSLGPAKGKDFATALGPWLVTPDELAKQKIPSPFGNQYNLRMLAKHNGKLVSEGNLKDMDWTFAEIIERASYGVELLPGDVIGSGTVGTGCYLELNGTWALQAKEKGEKFTPVWLQDGDEIELEITSLGTLKHKVVKAKEDYSILAKKKNV